MVFSNALKNLKGVVQDTTHYQMHQTDLSAALLDLWSIIQPDLTIADLNSPRRRFRAAFDQSNRLRLYCRR